MCVCCDRLAFENGVLVFSDDMKEDIEEKHEDIIERAIGGKVAAPLVNGNFYICHTCKNHISKNKIPPMSLMNDLHLLDISLHPELQLSELENSMIWLKLIF